MSGVIAVLGAVTVLALILRVATAALVLTGLPGDVARFQVRSAFFGAGFTTRESELVLNHPVRRQIAQWLIVGGAVGISGLVASSVISLAREGRVLLPLLTLLIGLGLLSFLASRLDRVLVRLSIAALRRTTSLEVHRYDALLRLSGEHAVSLIQVAPAGPLDGLALADLPAGVRPLGVQRRDGDYLDAPPATLVLAAGDALAVYGRDDDLSPLAPPPA